MTKPVEIYFLEGNIGAGKTTLLSQLNSDKFNILDEPMEQFCKLEKYNPLDLFYKKKISNFALSSYIISIFTKMVINNISLNKINILCRNPFSTVLCFSKLARKYKNISDIEFEILLKYLDIYEILLKDYKITFVYLKVSPEVCYKRMQKRNRKEEVNVEFEYIKDLDTVYNEYINNIEYKKIIITGETSNINLIKEDFLDRISNGGEYKI